MQALLHLLVMLAFVAGLPVDFADGSENACEELSATGAGSTGDDSPPHCPSHEDQGCEEDTSADELLCDSEPARCLPGGDRRGDWSASKIPLGPGPAELYRPPIV